MSNLWTSKQISEALDKMEQMQRKTKRVCNYKSSKIVPKVVRHASQVADDIKQSQNN